MRRKKHARNSIFAAALLVLTGTSARYGLAAETESQKQFNEFVSGASCGKQVLNLVENWSSKNHWHQQLGSLNGGHIYQSPTSNVGTWVRVVFYPDRSVEMNRINLGTRTTVTWKKTCEAQMRVQTAREPASVLEDTKFVTDHEIAEIVKSGKPGMIMAWSPNMPISYQGYAEGKKLAESMGLRFVAVVDPMADQDQTQAMAKAHGIVAQDARPMRSVELMARGMNLHYPSVLVFAHGQIADSLFPGYWEKVSVLKKHIQNLTQ
jgi:hypothetical protein